VIRENASWERQGVEKKKEQFRRSPDGCGGPDAVLGGHCTGGGAYLALHCVAGQAVPTAIQPGQRGAAMTQTLWRSMAGIGRYLLPHIDSARAGLCELN
jgi:hypothetical protein